MLVANHKVEKLSLHIPHSIAKEITVIFGQEGFYGRPHITQTESIAMPRVANSFIRPGQNYVPQRLQSRLEPFG